jgi:hypothetical protein
MPVISVTYPATVVKDLLNMTSLLREDSCRFMLLRFQNGKRRRLTIKTLVFWKQENGLFLTSVFTKNFLFLWRQALNSTRFLLSDTRLPDISDWMNSFKRETLASGTSCE